MKLHHQDSLPSSHVKFIMCVPPKIIFHPQKNTFNHVPNGYNEYCTMEQELKNKQTTQEICHNSLSIIHYYEE
jgi:hypothetical protein